MNKKIFMTALLAIVFALVVVLTIAVNWLGIDSAHVHGPLCQSQKYSRTYVQSDNIPINSDLNSPDATTFIIGSPQLGEVVDFYQLFIPRPWTDSDIRINLVWGTGTVSYPCHLD